MAKSKCEWKKLGDVCEINQGSSLPKKDMVEGLYNVIGGGKIIGTHNSFNSECNETIITRVGELTITFIENQYFLTENGLSLKHQNNITNKLIYYVLSYTQIKEQLRSLYSGGGQQVIAKTKLADLLIPIPSIEIQNEIVQMLDDLSHQKELLNDRKNGIENQMKYYFENQIKKNKDNIKLITIKELCSTVSGKQLSESKFIEGNYYVIGGGQKPSGKHNKFNKESNSILCSQSGSYSGFISKYDTPIWASDCFSIHSLNKEILNEDYLYYYLKQKQNNIYKLQTGGGQPHIYQDNINNFDLLLPIIDKQKELIDYLDKLENKKNSIDDELKDIDNLIKSILEQSYE